MCRGVVRRETDAEFPSWARHDGCGAQRHGRGQQRPYDGGAGGSTPLHAALAQPATRNDSRWPVRWILGDWQRLDGGADPTLAGAAGSRAVGADGIVFGRYGDTGVRLWVTRGVAKAGVRGCRADHIAVTLVGSDGGLADRDEVVRALLLGMVTEANFGLTLSTSPSPALGVAPALARLCRRLADAGDRERSGNKTGHHATARWRARQDPRQAIKVKIIHGGVVPPVPRWSPTRTTAPVREVGSGVVSCLFRTLVKPTPDGWLTA